MVNLFRSVVHECDEGGLMSSASEDGKAEPMASELRQSSSMAMFVTCVGAECGAGEELRFWPDSSVRAVKVKVHVARASGYNRSENLPKTNFFTWCKLKLFFKLVFSCIVFLYTLICGRYLKARCSIVILQTFLADFTRMEIISDPELNACQWIGLNDTKREPLLTSLLLIQTNQWLLVLAQRHLLGSRVAHTKTRLLLLLLCKN
ncbi:hypothetical protein DFS33DRAFT_1274573 [Desarmillaria ectypa]|nr:hypothetical protein DFS33DRAFT_1274573 [Desarmillaria ectypa]